MTTNSPNPVDGDVQALIEHIKEVLQEYDEHGGIGYGESVYRTALAAMTAEPVYQLIDDSRWYDAPKYLFDEAKARGDECRIVYTNASAQLLRPVELPDIEENEAAFKAGLNSLVDCLEDCGDAEQGLRLALRSISEKWQEVKS
ncbi:hypothetical protein [Pantoea ananatis]|uniref:hypothetical protein n=1 Tax=Pantoea ananas TaxID=553 RepID=UPI0030184CA3